MVDKLTNIFVRKYANLQKGFSFMDSNSVYTSLQQTIIEKWEKTYIGHPSYGSIAKELGCSPDTVYRTIQKYLQLNKK